MSRSRFIFVVLLVCGMALASANCTNAAGRHGGVQGGGNCQAAGSCNGRGQGQGNGNGQGAGPVGNQGGVTCQPTANCPGKGQGKVGGKGGSLGTIRQMQETGVVGTLTASGWTLELVQALPLSVTVTITTTYEAAGAPATLALVQPGLYVHMTGHFDATAHTFDASNVEVLLPIVEGTVQTIDGPEFTVLSQRGDVVSVTTSADTKWIATPVFKRLLLGGGGQGTAPISGTTVISGTPGLQPAVGPSSLAAGDTVVAEGAPGADGLSITALRVEIGVPLKRLAPLPGDNTGAGFD